MTCLAASAIITASLLSAVEDVLILIGLL